MTFSDSDEAVEAAAKVPDYDLPFMVNGKNVEHVSWWMRSRAASYRAAGAVEVSPSGIAFIRTTAKKYIPEEPSAGDGE